MYRALHLYACLPHGAASIRFLFVAPALCFRLPSDSRSPEKPLPSANTCPCRLCRGLSPPNECALPGAQTNADGSTEPSAVTTPLQAVTGMAADKRAAARTPALEHRSLQAEGVRAGIQLAQGEGPAEQFA